MKEFKDFSIVDFTERVKMPERRSVTDNGAGKQPFRIWNGCYFAK